MRISLRKVAPQNGDPKENPRRIITAAITPITVLSVGPKSRGPRETAFTNTHTPTADSSNSVSDIEVLLSNRTPTKAQHRLHHVSASTESPALVRNIRIRTRGFAGTTARSSTCLFRSETTIVEARARMKINASRTMPNIHSNGQTIFGKRRNATSQRTAEITALQPQTPSANFR